MKDVVKIKDLDGDLMQFTPKVCTDHEIVIKNDEGKETGRRQQAATFSGHVILKKIDLLKRLELAPQLEELRRDGSGIKSIAFAVKETMELWKGVNLTHLKSGKIFASLKEMMLDSRCDAIIYEVALGCIDGFTAANGESEGNEQGEE